MMARPASEVLFAEPGVTEKHVCSFGNAAKAADLFVIADFDRTITRCFIDSGRGCSAHGVLEHANVLSSSFQTKAQALTRKFHPIEIDPKLSVDEKIPLMNEWYNTVHALMLEEDVTRENIRLAVEGCSSIQLRPGMEQLIRGCQESSSPIPLLIMSAGLGDVIEEFLRQRLPFPLAPSTMVVSNRMIFDDDGRLNAFSEPLMHMFNKSAASLGQSCRELIAGRKHCLLMGDGVGDLTMADGIAGVTLLKFGFLNEKVAEMMEKYLGPYDVVVTNDGPTPDICLCALGIS